MLIESYEQGAPRKELHITPFGEHFSSFFGKVLMMAFTRTCNNLLKHCFSLEIFLMEGYLEGALRKELRNDPFVEHFKTATLGKSY